MNLPKNDRAIGCMLGGAFGDSLGAAVEFMALKAIRQRYGWDGIQKCDAAYGFGPGVITDDTQMAIATAVGLLDPESPFADPCEAIWKAYIGWLKSQSQPGECRAPGSTCLSALRSGKMGTIAKPLNHSAGCGAIMRAHPIGIAFAHDLDKAFSLGMESGAITHGHPNGYVPAGCLAFLVALLIQEKTWPEAIRKLIGKLKELPAVQNAGTLRAVESALSAPTEGDRGINIDRYIGQESAHPGGWLGHDALAIGIYAIRCCPHNPIEAVKVAVNHSGDSDSTGSIAGALMGVMYGSEPFQRHLNETHVSLEQSEKLTPLSIGLSRIH